MFNFDIGISGLTVAQSALDLIGTNMANATTPGYHRQDITIASKPYSLTASTGGAEVTGTSRAIDELLESEIARQGTAIGQTNQELSTLQTIESALGDVGSNNLINSMQGFYAALGQLASQPGGGVLSQQVISAGAAMATEFNNLSGFLSDTQTTVARKAAQQVDQINLLSEQIADLNEQIGTVNTRGGTANMLLDQRDELVNQLSGMISIRVQPDNEGLGMINVISSGMPLVLQTMHNDIALGKSTDGRLGCSIRDADFVNTQVQGGTLGGLVNLANDILPRLTAQLDTLAAQVASRMNALHVQGVGQSGSFTSLTGEKRTADKPIDAWGMGVQDGNVYLRITNTTTGQATRIAVSIDPSAQTLADVASAIDGIAGVSAAIVDSSLKIQSDSGYTFDFLPQMAPSPTVSAITGTSQAAFDGSYDDLANDTLSFTVVGSGEIGATDGLTVNVRNAAGNLLKVVNVGSGYAGGDSVDLGNGVTFKMSGGTLNDGDTFSVGVFADTDTANFLAAAGINTFFTGADAQHIAVKHALQDDPALLAGSSRADYVNNDNILKMSRLNKLSDDVLGGTTTQDYIQQYVTHVGQDVSTRQAAQASTQKIIDQLNQQRSDISGVDLNEQAAQLMVFQRMYQGLARYINTQDQALGYLMQII